MLMLCANFGAAAHLLGHSKRALEQLVQRHAHGACALGGAHGVFHLAQGGSPSTMS
jgi:hypothetical protein